MKTTKDKEVRFAWQIDPLDKNGRVQVTDNGVAFAEVQTIKAAEQLIEVLNLHEAYVELEKVAIKTVKILRDRYISDYELSQALTALAALKKGGG